MSLPVVPVRHHGIISGPGDDVLVWTSVGPSGELVAVWTAREARQAVIAKTISGGGASFPEPHAARPVTARITVHTPELSAVTWITDLALAHITVQPMPGGRFLIVGARCRWRRNGPDRNAVLYDAAGHVVGEQVLGDGIAHVLATAAGEVWVGYFDEGIYGNYGWGRPTATIPLARTGSSGSHPDWNPSGTLPTQRDRPMGGDQRLLRSERRRQLRLGLLRP